MLFTEPAFLFAFLPVLLGLYVITPRALRNVLLTVASLLFYTLGELRFLPFMIGSIALNYGVALWIESTRTSRRGGAVLVVGIASDLALLLVFKYAGWLAENLNSVLASMGFDEIHVPHLLLPLGISFFTFHKISYKVDVYRGISSAQRNPITLALYILFFPQLIAGPIIRYHDVADQLDGRRVTLDGFAEGVRRFMIGMAKKVIIANSVAVTADAIFSLPHEQVGFGIAWLGVLAYTLQIYFDFSGYSDMAIGLGLMFGFRFLENFDHPYASRSITEFWRRWHISLSRWFRDYLYVPLGGNRHGKARTYRNLMVVFFLCGLWHGASWAFVAWGLFHGLFLVLERVRFGASLALLPRVVAHGYTLIIVMVGWVFFRAETFGQALAFLRAMIGLSHTSVATCADYLDAWTALALIAGCIFSMPVRTWLRERWELSRIEPLPTLAMFATFFLCLVLVAAGTYNPFLYFRF
jgi:alginate O-acetyltransferase complex protein AlgI